MSEHTPGPWMIGTAGPNGCRTIGTTDGLMVAVVAHSLNHADQYAQAVANARLIADAPDMRAEIERLTAECEACAATAHDLLCALENIIDESPQPPEANCSCHINQPCSDCVDYEGLREAYRYARAAIAKAAGESA